MESNKPKHESKEAEKVASPAAPAPMSKRERLNGILRSHGQTMRRARALTEKILYNDKGAK